MTKTIIAGIAALASLASLGGPVLAQTESHYKTGYVYDKKHHYYRERTAPHPKSLGGKFRQFSRNFNHEINRESKGFNHGVNHASKSVNHGANDASKSVNHSFQKKP